MYHYCPKHAKMKITIIQVGKTGKKGFKEAENEYLKRLSAFASVNTVTVKEYTAPKGNNEAGIKLVKAKEGEQILAKIPTKTYIIILDERGEQLKSTEFAEFLAKKSQTESNITFVTGGCYGLDPKILQKADKKLSFSKFTFTHEMIRILLLEQLYRAFTIQKGKKYHY